MCNKFLKAAIVLEEWCQMNHFQKNPSMNVWKALNLSSVPGTSENSMAKWRKGMQNEYSLFPVVKEGKNS